MIRWIEQIDWMIFLYFLVPLKLQKIYYFGLYWKILLGNQFAGFLTFDLFDLLILTPGDHCYIVLVWISIYVVKCFPDTVAYINLFLTCITSFLLIYFFFSNLTLTVPLPTPDKEKNNLNVYFYISLWCLKRFYEGLKGLHETLTETTKKFENKNLS